MNTIIKNIEDAQLKAEVPAFNVGDTVRVSAKIKEGNRERIQVFEGTVLKKQGTGVSVFRSSRVQYLRDRVEATVRHSQLERFQMVSVLRRLGHYIHLS